jgi:hypothetical protein
MPFVAVRTMVKRSRGMTSSHLKNLKLFSLLATSLVIGGSLIAATPEAKAASAERCERLLSKAEKATAQFQAAKAQGDFGNQSKYYVRAQNYMKAFQSEGCN